MITLLEGILEKKTPTRIVLMVYGVGYEVMIPLSSYDRLPDEGETCRILTHHHVREDMMVLFGFTDEGERELFERLIGISGIGPKLALSVLSGMTVREFKAAIAGGDVKRLSSVSGIGKRTAERMILELKDRLSQGEMLEALAGGDMPGSGDALSRDAVMALVSLGYKQADAWEMIRKILTGNDAEKSVEELVRKALIR